MKTRRLPFTSVRVDTDDIPITERPLGRMVEGYGVGGEADNGRIAVDPRQTYTSMVIAVFDEALHEMWRRSQLAGKYKDTTEEFIVHELSPFIRSFLVDNPQWLEEHRNTYRLES